MTVDYVLWWRIHQLADEDQAAVEGKLRLWRFKRGVNRVGENLGRLGVVAASGATVFGGLRHALAAAHEAQLAEMRKRFMGRQD